MDRIDFPYSSASSATFIPQNDPLGRFTTRIIDSSQIVSSYETLWHDYMRLATSEYVPMPHPAQLVDPLASLVATDIIIAFETFLRELDETLNQTFDKVLFSWKTKKNNGANPYGFYFYKMSNGSQTVAATGRTGTGPAVVCPAGDVAPPSAPVLRRETERRLRCPR